MGLKKMLQNNKNSLNPATPESPGKSGKRAEAEVMKAHTKRKVEHARLAAEREECLKEGGVGGVEVSGVRGS